MALRFTALIAFLFMLVAGSAWEMHALFREGESELRLEAASLAKRAGLHLAKTGWEMDTPTARASIFAEMEDTRLAAMLVYGRDGFLEGMRRNGLWEAVPWNDLAPEHSLGASAPIIMEDIPAGEVIVYLSRRALDEKLSACVRRELARTGALALLPCAALALLLRRLAASRAERASRNTGAMQAAVPEYAPPAPQDWSDKGMYAAYLEDCRAFIRDQQESAALLYDLAARENWRELDAKAAILQEAALRLNERPLAAAAQELRAAALGNTASAARRVEECAAILASVFSALKKLSRGDGKNGEEA